MGKEHRESSARMTVIAVLTAGMLTKLGYGWWGIAVMVACCLLSLAHNPKPTESPLPRRAAEPAPG
jgi:hypothetical protein